MQTSPSAALSIEASAREDKFSAMRTEDDRKPRRWLKRVRYSSFWAHKWLGWAFVYFFLLFYFFVYRCVGLFQRSSQCTAPTRTGTLAWSSERSVSAC
jgi:hypothetical protein